MLTPKQQTGTWSNVHQWRVRVTLKTVGAAGTAEELCQ